MKRWHGIALVALASGWLATVGTADNRPAPSAPLAADAAALPPELRAYAGLIEDAQKFRQLTTSPQWKTVVADVFDDNDQDDPDWDNGEIDGDPCGLDPQPMDPQDIAAIEKIQPIDGRQALVLDLQKRGGGLVNIGPNITPPFAVEFKGELMADGGGDLSAFYGPIGTGAGFQYGAQLRAKNQIWAGKGPQASPMPNPPQTGKFYTIRLQVDSKTVTAWIDGQLVDRQPLAKGFNVNEARRVMLYTFGNKTAFADVKIERYGRFPIAAPKDAWKQAFGKLTVEQVNQKVAELVVYLDDSDPHVRDAAERCLRTLDKAALPSLKQIGSTGSPEQALRASRVIAAIVNPSDVDPPAPRTTTLQQASAATAQ